MPLSTVLVQSVVRLVSPDSQDDEAQRLRRELSTFSRTSLAPVPEQWQRDGACDAVPLPPGLRLADAVRRAQCDR